MSDQSISTLVSLEHLFALHRDLDIERLEEGLARNISHMHDAGERAIEYCKKLMAEGADVSEELKEMKALGLSFALMTETIKLEASRAV